MTFLLILAAIALFVVLLVSHPEGTIKVGCGVVILGIASTATIWYVFVAHPKRLQARVTITFQYLPGVCTVGTPLQITISNKGSRTLNKVSWSVSAFRPGYSDNLALFPPKDFESDRILGPGQSHKICSPLPLFTEAANGLDPAALSYVVDDKWVGWAR